MSFPKGTIVYKTKGPLVAVLPDGSLVMDAGGFGGRVFKSAYDYRQQMKDQGAWATYLRF